MDKNLSLCPVPSIMVGGGWGGGGGGGATCGVTVSTSAFHCLPPMLLCGFESRLGLESSGRSMWHFLKLVARGFLRVFRLPPLLHRFNGSANKIKLK